MYYVYILYSKSIDKYYVGQTYDLDMRIFRHSFKTTKYTKRADDWNLVYKEEFANRSLAMNGEKEIKSKKSREYIEKLISE
jgi:putative endonuclease